MAYLAVVSALLVNCNPWPACGQGPRSPTRPQPRSCSTGLADWKTVMAAMSSVRSPGRRRHSRLIAAGLAACGLLGVWAPAGWAAQVTGSATGWTRQTPAASPSARFVAAAASDPAARDVVLFGGQTGNRVLGDTWTWNGSTWTRRHPAVSPPARSSAAIAYDGAARQVVLFGGLVSARRGLNDTWTWNGTRWTKRHPATSPSIRDGSATTYDAAARQVVLFGGASSSSRVLRDTWTWNGSTWTRRHPKVSPPARTAASMTYDTATGTAVLFGGLAPGPGSRVRVLGDTWTWNGTSWTRRHPRVSPPARFGASMAYDTATGDLVLFGGGGSTGRLLDDTWTWNGSTWTEHHPAKHPAARYGTSMAYDATARGVVLFGGYNLSAYYNDTWIWR
jgi:hypothetical protein